MIELPDFTFSSAELVPVLFGDTVQPITGAQAEGHDRKGSRWQATISTRLYAEPARVLVSRLTRGTREGVRLPLPMQHYQGTPGIGATVDGDDQQGRTLDVKGIRPGWLCKEGFWLSIENDDGLNFLHQVATGGYVGSDGKLSIGLDFELRWPFENGDRVHLAQPILNGLVEREEWRWQLTGDMSVPISFTVTEVA